MPNIEEEQAERPNLALAQADPPPTQLLIAEYGDRFPFNVPISFQGSGSYEYQLWLNWDLDPRGDFPFLAGRLQPDDTAVKFPFTIDNRLSPGCQQVTLLVTPSDNIGEQPVAPIDMNQVAMATWWLNVAPQGDPSNLVDCPLKGTSTQN
jgi:hypothetical protein